MSSFSRHRYCFPTTETCDSSRKGGLCPSCSWLFTVTVLLVLAGTIPALAADLGTTVAVDGSEKSSPTTATRSKEKLWSATVNLGEEFNDNVSESSSARSDMITILRSTLKLDYLGNRSSVSLAYDGSLRAYAFGQRQNEILNNLNAKASIESIKNLLFVDVSDINKMVFTDATLGESTSSDSTSTQVNQNILKSGVTMKPVSWERTPVSLGASYTRITYWGGPGIDKSRQEVFIDGIHGISPRLDMGGDVRGVYQQAGDTKLDRLSATTVFRYTYAEGSYSYARVGLIGSQVEGGTNTLKPLVSAGLTHMIGRTTLSLNGQSGYIDNPSSTQDTFRSTVTASLYRQFDRSTLALNTGYTDYSSQGNTNTRQVTAGLSGEYDLTPRLVFVGSGTYLTNSTSDQTLNRLYGSCELRYELTSHYTLSMWYRSKLSHSSTTSSKNYRVNMMGFGLKKTF